jgi:hypothetical protein
MRISQPSTNYAVVVDLLHQRQSVFTHHSACRLSNGDPLGLLASPRCADCQYLSFEINRAEIHPSDKSRQREELRRAIKSRGRVQSEIARISACLYDLSDLSIEP